MRHTGPPLSIMPRTDTGLPLLALAALIAWTASAAALVLDLPAVAAALVLVPVAVGGCRDRRSASALAVLAGAVFAGLSIATGSPFVPALLGGAALAAVGVLFAGLLGAASEEAGTYRVWYHSLRDRLPSAVLFLMPATGRVHDLNGRAAGLLGPLQGRSLADAFEDTAAFDALTVDLRAGEVVGRGAWLRGPDGSRRWCELSGAMATPVLAVLSVTDRTVEREAGDALAASEARHRDIVGHLPGAALLVDEELRCGIAGGEVLAALVGDEEAVEGQTLWTAFPERVAQALEPLARLAVFGAPGTGEVEVDGRRLLLGASPVTRPDGTVAAAVLLATDASDLSGRLADAEWRRGLANALLEVHRAEPGQGADRLLAVALRLSGSRYGAVYRFDGDQPVPLSCSAALRDGPGRFEPWRLVPDPAFLSHLEEIDTCCLPEGHRVVRRLLTAPVLEDGRLVGLIVVADRSGPYGDQETAVLDGLAKGGFSVVLRDETSALEAARGRRFEAIVTSAPLPLLLFDREGRILFENAGAQRLFGPGAPADFTLRLAEPDRNRVRTTEERRRQGARGIPSRYLAGALGTDGAVRPCLVLAAFLRPLEASLFAFVELGVVAAHDHCRIRALESLEARIESVLRSDADDLSSALEAAWRASARERGVLGAPTPFESLPPDCTDYS